MKASMALTALALAVAAASISGAVAWTTTFTMHNLCPYPVWPLVTPNAGQPAIADASIRLDSNGLASLAFPGAAAWSGRVVPRTGCSPPAGCVTGNAPPVTVAQVSVNSAGGLAEYSVSLVDGFNVPATITPHAFDASQMCPVLGCAVDLNAACPGGARVGGGGGCMASPQFFKEMCPETRTTATDVEATPQKCFGPGELKVVFCPTN
ncbi:osmotin-like protein [Oryza brachyantha]|uniref:osmotin-like protein n=1 Tax=Oryza brachyantha TaxID=4533 RepID=UPI001ADA2090|nr:osmotin-like protein [Oryza brachyantha]